MQKEEVSLHTIKKRIIMTFLMAAMLVGGLTGLDGTYYESRSGQQEGQVNRFIFKIDPRKTKKEHINSFSALIKRTNDKTQKRPLTIKIESDR